MFLLVSGEDTARMIRHLVHFFNLFWEKFVD